MKVDLDFVSDEIHRTLTHVVPLFSMGQLGWLVHLIVGNTDVKSPIGWKVECRRIAFDCVKRLLKARLVKQFEVEGFFLDVTMLERPLYEWSPSTQSVDYSRIFPEFARLLNEYV